MANITKRGKSYRIIVSDGYTSEGKKITHTMTWTPDPGMTERQIEKALNIAAVEFESKVKKGQLLDERTRFADYIENYWLPHKEKEVEPTTYTRYKGMLKRLLPAFGHYKISAIRQSHIKMFYDNLFEEKRFDTKYTPTALCLNMCKGRKRADFARLAKISTSTFDSLRNGNNISEQNAIAVSEYLGLPVRKLFTSQEKPLSSRTVLHHHRVLSDIMQQAVYDGMITVNPVSLVRAPKVEQSEARYLDEKEAMHLLEVVADKAPKPYDLFIPLLIFTGMRRGEACGLEWNDIDFDNNLIHIVRSSLYLPEKGVFDSTPKTASSRRVIHIDDDIAELLRNHKQWQDSEAARLGTYRKNSGKVFTADDGRPINPGTVTKWFYDFVAENNLPDVCLHSLRHTCASLLLISHTPISAVAQRLGHSSTATTSRIYIHAIQSADAAAADTLHNILPLPKKNDDEE